MPLLHPLWYGLASWFNVFFTFGGNIRRSAMRGYGEGVRDPFNTGRALVTGQHGR